VYPVQVANGGGPASVASGTAADVLSLQSVLLPNPCQFPPAPIHVQAATGGGAVSVASGAAAAASNTAMHGNAAEEEGAGGLQIRYMKQVQLAELVLSNNKVRVGTAFVFVIISSC
jgi:hypothetical protein